ncbi:F-box protein [Phanerochaete sordida]|uniref:F-box protein n=1 Tax=Phanerochaete sordida TaxID=48140 RepID=A0A9P3LAP3_9APHY|nr:F-box protein [Phanerochaete sordida]
MSPRRSKRIKTAHPQAGAGASGASTGPATAQPAPRTAVAKATKPRRRRGKLAGLTELPLDVVIEVVLHLNPGDLLSLSRTTKAFRDLLMRRSSAFLWKAARENLEGYPPCPEDMNEPGLASFLYTNYCSSCLKPNVKWIYWEVRARYCKACAAALNKRLYKNLKLSSAVETGVPFTPTEGNWGLRAFLPTFFLDEDKRSEGSLPWITFEPDLIRLRDALTAEPDRYKEVLDEHMQRMKRIRECLAVIRNWHAQKLAAREKELKDIRRERYAEIIERLREDGWGEDLDRVMESEHGLGEFRDLPCVKEPRALTDRTWTNVSATLMQWFEGVRANMLEEERLRVSRARLEIFDCVLGSVFPYRHGEPSRVDIALGMPEIREIIERPPREAVTEESFAFLHDAFPAFRTRWRKQAEAYLGQLVRKAVGKLRKDVDPMQLAVAAAFYCPSCRITCPYPAVLSHKCDSLSNDLEAKLKNGSNPYRRVVLDNFMLQLYDWSHSRELIHWDTRVFKYTAEVAALKQVVALAGLDYKTATQADMDASPARFVCMVCDAYAPGIFHVLDWTKAYEHKHGRHRMTEKQYKDWKLEKKSAPYAGPSGCYIIALPEHHAETARTLESTAHCKRSAGPPWSCGRCPYLKAHVHNECSRWTSTYQKDELVEHIRQSHHVADPELGRDYFSKKQPGLDSMRPQVYLVSETLRTSSKPPLASQFAAQAAAYVEWEESDEGGETSLDPRDG